MRSVDGKERVGGVILPGTGRGTAGEAGGGGGVPQERRPEVRAARKLRRTMSLPEVLLWECLRSGKAGAKFRRQHPVAGVAFVRQPDLLEAALIVKVDGDAHNHGDQPRRDVTRERFLRENGYRLIRVPAVDVLRDPDAVANAIGALVAVPLHHAAHGPPPRAGEEQ